MLIQFGDSSISYFAFMDFRSHIFTKTWINGMS